MKSYTDLDQSKKLAEILPIESADMWWAERYEGKVTYDGQYIVSEEPFYYISFIKPSEINYSQDTVKDIPCWSLAALLEIIPEVLVERRIPDGWDCVSYAECQMTSANNFENLVDACVDVIYKLKERNLL